MSIWSTLRYLMKLSKLPNAGRLPVNHLGPNGLSWLTYYQTAGMKWHVPNTSKAWRGWYPKVAGKDTGELARSGIQWLGVTKGAWVVFESTPSITMARPQRTNGAINQTLDQPKSRAARLSHVTQRDSFSILSLPIFPQRQTSTRDERGIFDCKNLRRLRLLVTPLHPA